MVRAVLLEVYGTKDAEHRLGWVAGKHEIVFYTDDVCITGLNPICVKETMEEILHMFERVGLNMSLGTTKYMVCNPRTTWWQQGEAAYKHRSMGEGCKFRQRKRIRVICK